MDSDAKVLLLVPDEIESYNSPLVLNYKNGSKYILFGSGGETTPGSLWILDFYDLIATKSTRSARKLLHDDQKGSTYSGRK